MKHPWTRRADEPAGYHSLFLRYLHMGETRTIRGLCRSLGSGRIKAVEKIAAEHQWIHRADEWDAHQAETRTKTMERGQLASAVAERAAIGYLSRAASIIAKDFLMRVKEAKAAKQIIPISVTSLVTLVSESTKLARLVRGEATEISAVSGARERLVDRIEKMAEAFKKADARKDMPNT